MTRAQTRVARVAVAPSVAACLLDSIERDDEEEEEAAHENGSGCATEIAYYNAPPSAIAGEEACAAKAVARLSTVARETWKREDVIVEWSYEQCCSHDTVTCHIDAVYANMMLAQQHPLTLGNGGAPESLYATVRRQRRHGSPVVTQAVNGDDEDNNGSTDMFFPCRYGNGDQDSTMQRLEAAYGGREVAHAAATAIQRGWRAARLRGQFARLLQLAHSSERLERRLSLLGPDDSYDVQRHQKVSRQNSSLRCVEEDIDRLILEAAGLIREQQQQQQLQGPSERLINKSKKANNNNSSMIRRSASMKAPPSKNEDVAAARIDPLILSAATGEAKGSNFRSRDDLDLPPSSPVPPCPPLRGEAVYNNDEIYVTRDDLYSQNQGLIQAQQHQEYVQQHHNMVRLQQQRHFQQHQHFHHQGHHNQLQRQDSRAARPLLVEPVVGQPPRPPQRTVSFLANGTLPRKISRNSEGPIGPSNHQIHKQVKINSDGDLYNNRTSSLSRRSNTNLAREASATSTRALHTRSMSSPAPLSMLLRVNCESGDDDDENEPLPPPPYISPPPASAAAVKRPPLMTVANPPTPLDSPLPPPPPVEVVAAAAAGRPPVVENNCCASASSASSVDSGYYGGCGIRGSSTGGESVGDNNRIYVSQHAISPNAPPAAPAHHHHHHQSVFEPRNSYGYLPHLPHLMPRQLNQHSARNQSFCSSTTASDIYGQLSKPHAPGTPVNYMPRLREEGGIGQREDSDSSPKIKKTVRIQTPEQEENSQNVQILQQQLQEQHKLQGVSSSQPPKVQQPADDVLRRRQYRVGLNLFNQNPALGMEYLLKKSFLDFSPLAAAKFLRGRKGLSRSAVGLYLTELRRPFNLAALHCFIHELDLAGLHLDLALRKLQQEMTLPGEAQKIEKVVEVFSKRYIQCNQMFVAGFRSPDTIFVLSYAIVLLNTDLHNANNAKRKSNCRFRRMRKEEFVRNLRGVDAGADLDEEMLNGIYDRIRANEFRPGSDHVTQVAKVEESISFKGRTSISFPKPLAASHRRLVCFCRLTEVPDGARDNGSKKVKPNQHQRGVFLFNDLLVVTKTIVKKASSSTHQFRSALTLASVRVNVFSTGRCQFGIELQDRLSGRIVATFDARSASDQQRLVADLQESIAETLEMERAKMFLNSSQDMEESFC